MHKSGARKFTVRPWFVNEGTILVRLNYSKGGFEMIQADERRAQTPRGQSKQVPVSIRCYPFGAGEMALEGLPRPIRFVVGIDLQHDPRHLALVDKLPCTKLRDGVIAPHRRRRFGSLLAKHFRASILPALADAVDAIERRHDISCTVDPGHLHRNKI